MAAAAVLPLLTAVPGAEAFNVRSRKRGVPKRFWSKVPHPPRPKPDSKPLKGVTEDTDRKEAKALDDWVAKFFHGVGPMPWEDPKVTEEQAAEAAEAQDLHSIATDAIEIAKAALRSSTAADDVESHDAFTPRSAAPSSGDAMQDLRHAVHDLRHAVRGSTSEEELRALEELGGGDVASVSWVKADSDLQRLIEVEADGRGSMSAEHKVRLLVELLRAVAKIEKKGWVHGDIRPHNILLFGDCLSDEGCHAKLGGLGAARPLAEIATADVDAIRARDPSPYLAPEVAAGETDLSKSDIWSAGAVALQLMSGGQAGVALQLMRRTSLATENIHELVDLDARLAELVRIMLERSPESRPTAADALRMATQIAELHEVVVPEQSFGEPQVADAAVVAAEPSRARTTSPAEVYVTVEEIEATTLEEAAHVANQIAALERFGGGDVVSLIGATQHTDPALRGITYKLTLEAADGTCAGLIAQEQVGSVDVALGQKIRLLVEILRGVAKLEDAGWLHGGLTPDAVQLFGSCAAPEGCHAKLASFEHAHPVDEAAEPRRGPYAAPEARKGGSGLAKADVWSVGVLMYELFVGATPDGPMEPGFWPEDLKALRQQDHQLARLARGMLAFQPEERLSAKAALAEALRIARRHGVDVPEQAAAQ